MATSTPATREPSGERTRPGSRPVVDKVTARRDELAAAALRTLAERGYANTSLREIAQNSEYSHGVLHYYFADKTELIRYCVRLYKQRCVRRYDRVGEDAQRPQDVLDQFVVALLESLHEDASEQRLWYDMRAQSLFEPQFRADVDAIDGELRDMVWRILIRYSDVSGLDIGLDADTAYALFDGVFTRAVYDHLAGDAGAAAVLDTRIRNLIPRLFTGP